MAVVTSCAGGRMVELTLRHSLSHAHGHAHAHAYVGGKKAHAHAHEHADARAHVHDRMTAWWLARIWSTHAHMRIHIETRGTRTARGLRSSTVLSP